MFVSPKSLVNLALYSKVSEKCIPVSTKRTGMSGSTLETNHNKAAASVPKDETTAILSLNTLKAARRRGIRKQLSQVLMILLSKT